MAKPTWEITPTQANDHNSQSNQQPETEVKKAVENNGKPNDMKSAASGPAANQTGQLAENSDKNTKPPVPPRPIGKGKLSFKGRNTDAITNKNIH